MCEKNRIIDALILHSKGLLEAITQIYLVNAAHYELLKAVACFLILQYYQSNLI